MKKTLSKIQLILATICASALIWLIIYELFNIFDIILKPFKVIWITFTLLVIVSIIITFALKKK